MEDTKAVMCRVLAESVAARGKNLLSEAQFHNERLQPIAKQCFTNMPQNVFFDVFLWNVKTHGRASLHASRL